VAQSQLEAGMIDFLRKLFRRNPPPKMSAEEISAALRRREEKLPCCGEARYAHVYFRSGKLHCPRPITGYLKNGKLDLRYNPLEIDEEFFPSWSEGHFKCRTCECARGVHHSEGFKRTTCFDPDCPGCPKGCT
jgi:hypothetical protein